MDSTQTKESPVANVNAQEAIAQIANMRSVEKLKEIANTDKRATVVEAASKRLTEVHAQDRESQVTAAPIADLGTIESGRSLTLEEVNKLDWEKGYPLKTLTGKQSRDAIAMMDNADNLEVIIHEDKRMTVVEAAKERLRTTASSRKRKEAREAAGIYRVEYNGQVGEYRARDSREAWALFNDAQKASYGPKVQGRRITKVRSLNPDELPDNLKEPLSPELPQETPREGHITSHPRRKSD